MIPAMTLAAGDFSPKVLPAHNVHSCTRPHAGIHRGL
jgi:hypothetical protein